jgi:hypothetical protein
MRTVTAGLLLLCLLGIAAPAIAQTADPLGLISFGALVPYVDSGTRKGEMSFLLSSSPVGSADLHMFFFDSTCIRGGPSVSVSMTANDMALLRLDNSGLSGIPTSGLVAIAAPSQEGFSLVPLSNPIHAHVLWINAKQDFLRILEPIAIQNAEASDTSQVWNPLRTAAAFYAERETAKSKATLVLICPTQSVITGAFPSSRFPELVPAPVVSGGTPIRVRVYDDDELFLRDLLTTCNCLSFIPLKALDPIYSDASLAPDGTYTELEGGGPGNGPFSFTGYLATDAGARERFGRLHNGNITSIRGTLTPGVR